MRIDVQWGQSQHAKGDDWMKKLLAVCCSLLCCSSWVQAKRTEQEKQIRLAYERAVAYMEDDSFYQKYRSFAYQSPEQAKDIIQRATERQGRITQYIDHEVTRYCNQRFFVNHCIDKVRERSIERRRENNRVIEAANEYMRLERLKNMKSRQKEVRERSEPVQFKPRRVREPSKPIQWSRRKVREPSEPVQFSPRRVRRASKPVGMQPKRLSRGMSEQRRRLIERANEKAFEEKQREAQIRKEKAKEYARKRRLDREEHRQRWQKSLEERYQAQRRAENSKNKQSTLEGYFQ